MNKYLTEFIGTFFLVLVIGLTGNPLAIGSALMVMVYMGGHISGAHYNPAVTIAITMRGKCEGREVAPYIVAQILGAVAAGCVFYALTAGTFAPAPGEDVEVWRVLVAEVVFTFALALVVLNTATHSKTDGRRNVSVPTSVGWPTA